MDKTITIKLSDAPRYGYSPISLVNGIKSGKITIKQNERGEFTMTIPAKTKDDIISQKYPKLVKMPIKISSASEKYNVPNTTIRGWIDYGWVEIVDNGYPKQIDESQIAYVSEIYHQRKEIGMPTGAPLLDEDGLPYQILHPDLSEKRRES